MKYRIEIQQVFGTTGVEFDDQAQWLESGEFKPRGLAAAKQALIEAVDRWKTGGPHRIVAIAADGSREVVEVLAYVSPLAKMIAEDEASRTAPAPLTKTEQEAVRERVAMAEIGAFLAGQAAANMNQGNANPHTESLLLATAWNKGYASVRTPVAKRYTLNPIQGPSGLWGVKDESQPMGAYLRTLATFKRKEDAEAFAAMLEARP